jgi:hypothetical protein|tara:strand:+ start:1590 stop:1892 length:303 start_codon:yes stop_codon:yes gene_type:complete
VTHDDIKELVEKYGSEKVKKAILSIKESSDSKPKKLNPLYINEAVDAVKMIKLYAPIVKGTMNNMVVAINKDEHKKLKKFHQQFNFYTKKISEFAEQFLS